MKLLKKSYPLAYMIFFPFMVATVYTFFFAGGLYVDGLSWHWLFVVVFALMLNHKHSGIRIRVYQKKRPLWLWLLQMVSFQLALCFLFLGFANQYHHPANALLDRAFYHFGAFPYVLFSVVAGAIAYQIHLGRQPLLSSTLTPWFHNSHLDDVGSMIDTMARSSSLYCIGLLIHLCVLLGATQINQQFGLTYHTTLNFSSMLVMVFFMFIPTTPHFRQVLRPLNTYLPNAITALLGAVLILFCVYGIYAFSRLLIPHHTLEMALFAHDDHVHYTALLIYLFMMGWGILYTGFIVHISQGYSIRQMMTTTLLTPISFHILYSYQPNLILFNKALPLVTFLSVIFLFLLLLNQRNLPMVMRAKLPTETLKSRPPYQFFSSAIAFAGYFTAYYLVVGPYVTALAGIVFITPVMLLLALSARSFFSKKKADGLLRQPTPT